MLKQRVLTAAILIPLVFVGIFYTSPLLFRFILAGVLLLAGWEWSQLIPLKKAHLQTGYLVLIAAAFYLSSLLSANNIIILGAVAWIGVSYYLAVNYIQFKQGAADTTKNQQQSNENKWGQKWLKQPTVISLVGIFTLTICFISISFLRDQNVQWVIMLLLIVWIADIAAYFSGRRFGQHALAPYISPKKTWEGVLGALFAVVIIIFFGGWLMNIKTCLLVGLALLGILTTLISIIGDLFESLLKRQSGVKDSGQLLPGHGGILDRIDSLIAAAPCFAAGILLTCLNFT